MTTRMALVRFVDRHEGILSASDLLTLDPLIAAIEAEAVAAERVRLAEAVRALPFKFNPFTGTSSFNVEHDRDQVLRLLEDTSRATPSKAEPAKPKRAKRIDWSDVVVDEGDEAP